ncbi:MAG: ABC transporter substrate-binding protein [Rhodospirillales bacterium]
MKSVKLSLKMTTQVLCGAVMAVTLQTGAASSADEVNLYSARQPFLMAPLIKEFTAKSGIKVNMVYLKKGMLERLKAEGANSPADLILTTDIGNLNNHLNADVLQATKSSILEANIPDQYRHPEGKWYGLTTRARIIFAHKTRVKTGEVTSYEDLAAPHMKGRVCTRSGKNVYNVSLLASIIEAKGEAAAEAWAKGLKANLARKPKAMTGHKSKQCSMVNVMFLWVIPTIWVSWKPIPKNQNRKTGQLLLMLSSLIKKTGAPIPILVAQQ